MSAIVQWQGEERRKPRYDSTPVDSHVAHRLMLKPTATRALLACAFALAACAPARAQTWQDKWYLNANLGFHLYAPTTSETLTPVIYDERASIVTTSAIDFGMIPLDVGGGIHIWRNLGAGGAYTRFSATSTANVDARVPHPIQFNQPRFASATAELNHEEWAIHMLAIYVLPLTERIDLALSGGPVLMNVKQDHVSGIQIAEESPTFATVTIAKAIVATTENQSWNAVVGADLTYFLTPMIGVGFALRVVPGSDAGHLQLGVGARLRFR
jgi:hypothetical protein